MMMKKVVVAMSGGVDSSVAAALLKEEGYAVEGVFMKNWSPTTLQSLTDCPWEQDQADAAAVCEQLGIPFRSVNFEREYKERVVDYFLREYAAGRTPNPDVMCNKEIKFDAFLKEAEKLGADYIATGHYAQVVQGKYGSELWRGLDGRKDQSYFLYTLQGDSLRRTIFPLGHYTKQKVRELAVSFSLPTAQKKDSQGICFIGHIDLKEFLHEALSPRPGELWLLPPFNVSVSFSDRLRAAVPVGQHTGVSMYTIGERPGYGVDNGRYRKVRDNADVPPLYILHKDQDLNRLYLTDDHNDPDFQVKELYLESWLTTGGDGVVLPSSNKQLLAQVRYQQKVLSPVKIISQEEAGIKVEFSDPPLFAVAPGQSLVLYTPEGQVVGGGVVSSIGQRNEL